MGHPPESHLTPPALWRRAAALLTDALTVFFLLWALAVVQALWFMDRLSHTVDPQPWGTAFAPTLAYGLLFSGYQLLFLVGNEGRSPGKEVFGVRVVGRDGSPPSPLVCVVRTLALVPAFLVPPVWVGLLLVVATGLPTLFDLGGRARSWPDLVARTRTVAYVPPKDETPRRRRGRPATADDVQGEAVPPTLFTMVIGRKNTRRFARAERNEPPDEQNGVDRR